MRVPNQLPLNLAILSGIIFFLPFCAFAQLDEREILYDKLEPIGMFKKVVKAYELKEGEEVLMNIEVVGGKKLSRFIIDQPGTPLQMYVKKLRRIERGGFVASREGEYFFTFKNKSIFKRNVRIQIEKYPKKGTRDTMILDDIIFTRSIDTLHSPYADTLPFPDIASYNFTLQPSLDYKSNDDSCVFIPLIDNEPFQFAVYWIGIGESAKREYDKLKANPPPSWTMKGINEPLFAYAKGLTQQLPESKSSLSKNVRFALKDPASKDNYLDKDVSNKGTYGVIPVYKAGKYKAFRLCFRNFNTTTKVPIYIYVAKFQLEKRDKEVYIKRERIQEVFIKKQIEYYQKEE